MDIERPYFKSLDVLRFIAASMVVLQHSFGEFLYHLFPENLFAFRLFTVLCDGSLGVSLFFVLSGFLITYLLVREKESTGSIRIDYFYMRRILRIWPLYFAVLLFALFLYPVLRNMLEAAEHLYCNKAFMYFFFLSNFDVISILRTCPGQDLLMLNITWSVAIEEQFYLLWPLLFASLPKKFWWVVLAILLALSLSFKIVNTGDRELIYFHTLSVIYDLVIGSMAALLLFSSTWRSVLNRISQVPVAYIVIGLLALNTGAQYTEPAGITNILLKCLNPVLFALLIISSLSPQCPLTRFEFLSKMGVWTYGIYLLHPVVLAFLHPALKKLDLVPGSLQFGLLQMSLCFIFTLLVSALSYRFFESYFLRLKGKFVP